MSEQCVREPAWHGVQGRSLAATLPSPPIRVPRTAFQHGTTRRQLLPNDFEASKPVRQSTLSPDCTIDREEPGIPRLFSGGGRPRPVPVQIDFNDQFSDYWS